MRGRWHSLAISIGAKISSQTQWPVSRPRFCYYFSLPETSPVRYEKWEIFSVLCSQLCDFVGVRPKPNSAQHRIIIHLSDFLIVPIAFALLFSVLWISRLILCVFLLFFFYVSAWKIRLLCDSSKTSQRANRRNESPNDILAVWSFGLSSTLVVDDICSSRREKKKKLNYRDDRIV